MSTSTRTYPIVCPSCQGTNYMCVGCVSCPCRACEGSGVVTVTETTEAPPAADVETGPPEAQELVFPPPVISRWLARQGVDTQILAAELRRWAEWWVESAS